MDYDLDAGHYDLTVNGKMIIVVLNNTLQRYILHENCILIVFIDFIQTFKIDDTNIVPTKQK